MTLLYTYGIETRSWSSSLANMITNQELPESLPNSLGIFPTSNSQTGLMLMLVHNLSLLRLDHSQTALCTWIHVRK